MLGERDIKDLFSRDTVLVEMMGDLLHSPKNSEEALHTLTSKIRKRLPPSEGSALRTSSSNLKWGLFTKKGAKDLQARLEATNSTFNTALETIIV